MFADKMKELRQKHHMTQAELAQALGLSPSAVGMYEQGRREPDLSIIMKLCHIFQVPADHLLGNDEPERNFEIRDVLQDIQTRLLSADSLTLDGSPISRNDIHRLVDAIEVSTAVVLDRVEKPDNDQ